MQIRYLPALIMLIAAALGCIMGIVKHYDTSYMMKMEIIVMIIFFVIGKIARNLIGKIIESVNKEEDTEEEIQEENENISNDV